MLIPIASAVAAFMFVFMIFNKIAEHTGGWRGPNQLIQAMGWLASIAAAVKTLQYFGI